MTPLWDPASGDHKLEFAYDYLGRRVQKTISTWSGSSWTFSSARRFAYDGFNLVAEFDSPSGTSIGSLKRSYTWGLDIASGSSTGGVGALVQMTDHVSSTDYLPTYDGNGNLAALVDAEGDGSTDAVYEYTPFGELLRAEGPYADDNPFRFSTKFTDVETGMVYYGFRYYDPANGRFLNRDPIEEAGGLNVYGFVGNDPVNRLDVLGLYRVCYDTIETEWRQLPDGSLELKTKDKEVCFDLPNDIPFENLPAGYYLEGSGGRGNGLPNKSEHWSEETCNQWARYLNNLAAELQNTVNDARTIADDYWDSVRRGAGAGLSISQYIPGSGGGWATAEKASTYTGIGAGVGTLYGGFRETTFNQLVSETAEFGKNSLPGGSTVGTLGKYVGKGASAVGATIRFQMATEAAIRGDWSVAFHYEVTGLLTAATMSIKDGYFNGAVMAGSIGEGFLWQLGDQQVNEALTKLDSKLAEGRSQYADAYAKWEANCK